MGLLSCGRVPGLESGGEEGGRHAMPANRVDLDPEELNDAFSAVCLFDYERLRYRYEVCADLLFHSIILFLFLFPNFTTRHSSH